MGTCEGSCVLSRSSRLYGQRESRIRRPPIPWSASAPQLGWGHVALTTLLLTISAPGFGDVRGQVVCGIPPDEAVAFVYPTRSGDWEYVGMAGAPMHQWHPSVEAALDEHAPEQAEYVCDVEIRDTPIRMVPARLYRLHRKFIAYGTVDEATGDVLRGEYDPRQVIVGVAANTEAEDSIPLRFPPYGAVANGGPDGSCVAILVWGRDTQRAADAAVLDLCRSQCGEGCAVQHRYANECIAVGYVDGLDDNRNPIIPQWVAARGGPSRTDAEAKLSSRCNAEMDKSPFLYCNVTHSACAPAVFGALVASWSDGSHLVDSGIAVGYSTPEAAKTAALGQCQPAGRCPVELVFSNTCVAFAEGFEEEGDSLTATGTGRTETEARDSAMERCGRRRYAMRGSCTIRHSGCALPPG